MNKQKKFTVVAAIIMLIGIIIAYSCDLRTSTIFEFGEDVIKANIGTHVFVIMLFVVASTAFLFLACRYSADEGVPGETLTAFLGAYALSGLFFSLASAFQARSTALQNFYYDMKSAPSWYSDEVINTSWFNDLPEIADGFSSSSTFWYVLMIVAIGITIFFGARAANAYVLKNQQM